eukprot:12754510-Alexandrium_andersonii.AAC.1
MCAGPAAWGQGGGGGGVCARTHTTHACHDQVPDGLMRRPTASRSPAWAALFTSMAQPGSNFKGCESVAIPSS